MLLPDEIPVFHAFARSGGTMLNQCLGVSPGNLVLSEVNPTACCRPIVRQAEEWLGLTTREDRPRLAGLSYAEQIRELHHRARQRNQCLILRDWTTVNFLPETAAPEIEPSRLLEQASYLALAGLQPRSVVLVRRAAEVYYSIQEHLPHLRHLELEVFSQAYLAYARAAASLPRFKLEDLVADPATVVPAIARALGVALAPDFQKHYPQFEKCTGHDRVAPATSTPDIESISSRGVQRRPLLSTARQDPALHEADQLFGYATQP